MIKGLKDSGRRMVFAYSAGTDRSAEGLPFEFPGAMNDTTKGIGRVAKTHFASRNQLVTLGFAGGPGAAFAGAAYTGWQLGRSFGASLHNHVVGNPQGSSVRLRTHEMVRTVRRDVHPRHQVAGHAACADRLWRIGLPRRGSIEGLGDLP
jgi:hypothetical protein